MSQHLKAPRQLIEAALPVDDINSACAREKRVGRVSAA